PPSAQEKSTVTSWFVHVPALYGVSPVLADAVTDGAVASRLTVTLLVVVPPRFVAEHVNVVPFVSAVTDWSAQPLLESAPVTFQRTETSPVYQPFVPCLPLTSEVTVGACGTTSKSTPPGPLRSFS